MDTADTSTTQTETTQTEAPAPDAVAPGSDAPAPSLDDGTILGEGDKPADAPSADATPEGAPETYELTMPEGMTLDADAMALAEPVFRDLNLTNEQASKLAAVYPQIAQAAQDRASQGVIAEVVAQRKAWADESRAHPVYGGAEFEASKTHAARFIDNYGGADLRKVMDETGLGNHPVLFAAFAKAGLELAEDQQPRDPGTPPAPKTLGEKYYGASA